MGTSSKALADGLSEVVAAQGGYFTASQAVEAGYADSVHAYHVRNGDWVKVQRGIYRLASHQEPDRPELIIWSLWSRGRDGRPQGVYSRKTALEIHGLAKSTFSPLEMTVPSDFRRNSELPDSVVLFKEDLAESDVEDRGGYRVTSLDKTLRDAEELGIHPKISAKPSKQKEAGLHIAHHMDDIIPKISAHPRMEREEAVKVAWDDRWDGEFQAPSWSDGRSFEKALDSGED